MICHLERRELAKQDLDGALFFINELLQSRNSFTQQGDFCRSAINGGALLREGRCRKEAAFLLPLFVGWVRVRQLCLFAGVLPGRRVCVPREWA